MKFETAFTPNSDPLAARLHQSAKNIAARRATRRSRNTRLAPLVIGILSYLSAAAAALLACLVGSGTLPLSPQTLTSVWPGFILPQIAIRLGDIALLFAVAALYILTLIVLTRAENGAHSQWTHSEN